MSSTGPLRTSVLSIGEHRGHARIWVEGRFLKLAGFDAGQRYSVSYGSGQITIHLDMNGGRIVSGKRQPVIDLQNTSIRHALPHASKIEVITSYGHLVITAAKSEVRKASRLHDDSTGSVFSGGGLLDEAAKQVGYRPRFAIEWSPEYADVWQANHPGHLFNSCISEVDFRRLPPVSLLTLGIPCEPFSQKRRQARNVKRVGGGYADHELADMSIWSLFVVEATNPSTVIIENVPAYLESDIGQITMAALRRMGYHVDSNVIVGTDYGALTTRKRGVIVGSDRPIKWPSVCPTTRTMASVLLPPDHLQCEWFHASDPKKAWLFKHWAAQAAKGNGFASQQVTPDTPAVQTISKRYFAGQGDAPVVKDTRPGREGWFRWLTLSEVKSIMGLPGSYDLGDAKTFAGEVMGQGVLVDVFRQIIQSVAPLAVDKRRAA